MDRDFMRLLLFIMGGHPPTYALFFLELSVPLFCTSSQITSTRHAKTNMEQQANNIATTTNHLNGNPSTHKSPHTASMAPSSINNMRTVGTAVAASASAATMLPRLQHQPHCHHLHWRCCHRRRRRRRRQMRFPATESVSRTRSQPKTTCTNILLTCGHQNATKTPTTTTTTRATRSCGQRRHELIAMVIIMMLGAVNVCRAKADQPDIQQPVAKRLISGAAGDQNDWVCGCLCFIMQSRRKVAATLSHKRLMTMYIKCCEY